MQTLENAPQRLHHNAYVVKDLGKTRWFYEDLLGMPLQATWCEKSLLFGKERTYAHCFFGLKDESALAFFQFAGADDQAEFGPELTPSPFRHIALKVESADDQQQALAKLKEAGYPKDKYYFLDHGYCKSLYVIDPDDLIVEFTVDHPDVENINKMAAARAHAELERWLGGDHAPNNDAYLREKAV